MSSRRFLIQEEVTLLTLRLIQDNSGIRQRGIAAHVGISVGAVNYCLSALAEKGLIKLSDFQTSKNKRVYVLTPQGVAAKATLTVAFLERKLAEYETLESEIAALKDEIVDGMRSERNTP